MTHSRIRETAGIYALTFSCADLPSSAVVAAAGHDPSGYFWEGIATLIAPEIVALLELDSDTDTFRATGLRDDLEELRNKLEPVISRPDATRAALRRADAEGFELHD
jgi:hypothetical protein